jgi:hypothetical protein
MSREMTWQQLRELGERNKELFPKGTRVRLIHMGADPDPVPDGSEGTVEHVDDVGTISVKFDNGRHLGVCPPEDTIERIES